ncbi:MAG: hypothetical protein AB1813_29545, partial [Verrucomicrobiota bacterium]
ATAAYRQLFDLTYKAGTGRVHTVKDGIDLALVKKTDLDALNATLSAAQKIAEIGGSPEAGYVYVAKTAYQANANNLTILEYIPEWARTAANLPPGWTLVEQGTEILHVSQFLGEVYDNLPVNERPNYYVKVPYTKIKKSAAETSATKYSGRNDIKKAIYLGEDAVTYANVGQTRWFSSVKLHQIGWWYPGWNDNVSDLNLTVAQVLKPGWTWDAAWGPTSKKLSEFIDLRTTANNPDDSRSANFQTGVKKPSSAWVEWYQYEFVSSQRDVALNDRSQYSYTSAQAANATPPWAAQAPTVTRYIAALNKYVRVPETSQVRGDADEDIALAVLTGNLTVINWDTDGDHLDFTFGSNLSKDTGGDSNTATKQIPVNATQGTDIANRFVGNFSEFLGQPFSYSVSASMTFNSGDWDLHAKDPSGDEIYYGDRFGQYISLNQDSTNGGTETISGSNLSVTGTYSFWRVNFSAGGTITANSIIFTNTGRIAMKVNSVILAPGQSYNAGQVGTSASDFSVEPFSGISFGFTASMTFASGDWDLHANHAGQHIYYGNRTGTWLSLNADSTTGGTETISGSNITQTGSIDVYMHNFSNGGSISDNYVYIVNTGYNPIRVFTPNFPNGILLGPGGINTTFSPGI